MTPRRGALEDELARLGAKMCTENVPAGSTVKIGVGLAEEVCNVLCDSGMRNEITFTTESGPYGGLPAPGVPQSNVLRSGYSSLLVEL